MAVFNEIGIGRWNRFIQKLTDMKGGPPARQLSSEISFQHPIFHGNENRYLEGWDMFSAVASMPALAAATDGLRLRNPAGSNVVAVVTLFQVFAPAGNVPVEGNVILGAAAADLATVIALTQSNWDPRGRSASSLSFTKANNPGSITGAAVAAVEIPTQGIFNLITSWGQEIPLLPGFALQWQTTTVNIVSGVNLFWRERFLEPAERF